MLGVAWDPLDGFIASQSSDATVRVYKRMTKRQNLNTYDKNHCTCLKSVYSLNPFSSPDFRSLKVKPPPSITSPPITSPPITIESEEPKPIIIDPMDLDFESLPISAPPVVQPQEPPKPEPKEKDVQLRLFVGENLNSYVPPQPLLPFGVFPRF